MDQAITTALWEIDPNIKPITASAHLRIGKALVAVQRVDQAVGHFRTACQMDTQGHSGMRALQELERLAATG